MTKARKLSREKSLSGLLNACLADWIAHHSQKELEARLAVEYRESSRESRRTIRDFAAVDKDGWPPW